MLPDTAFAQQQIALWAGTPEKPLPNEMVTSDDYRACSMEVRRHKSIAITEFCQTGDPEQFVARIRTALPYYIAMANVFRPGREQYPGPFKRRSIDRAAWFDGANIEYFSLGSRRSVPE